MDPLFQVHKLNEAGIKKAVAIAEGFDELLTKLNAICLPKPTANLSFSNAQMEIVRARLEEACFFAKKSMANQSENQL
jgi:hypothetical protein